MSQFDDQRDRRGGGGKPPASPGISPAEARDLRAQMSALSSRVERLDKLVRDHFDEKNQWNSIVREWVGKQVIVELVQAGRTIEGELLWLDRYTICVKALEDRDDPFVGTAPPKSKVIHKAAIALIYLAG